MSNSSVWNQILRCHYGAEVSNDPREFSRGEAERLLVDAPRDVQRRVLALVECLCDELDRTHEDCRRERLKYEDQVSKAEAERDGQAELARKAQIAADRQLDRDNQRHDAVESHLARGMGKMEAAEAVAREDGLQDSRVVLDAHSRHAVRCSDCRCDLGLVLALEGELVARCPECEADNEPPTRLLQYLDESDRRRARIAGLREELESAGAPVDAVSSVHIRRLKLQIETEEKKAIWVKPDLDRQETRIRRL